MKLFLTLLLFTASFIHPLSVCAQDTITSDGLFQTARKAALDEKDYPRAKVYLYRALAISPGYSDIRILLGRIYSWTNHYDSAAYCFATVLAAHPDYEDASIAYANLARWNDRNDTALRICNDGLRFHPASQELLLTKARVLTTLREYAAADSAVRELLHINKDNTAARSLADNLRELSVRNKIDLTYDFVYFDKQFDNPWHLVSLDYGRTTKYGTITGRVNYANRFGDNGTQYELEAYPHISRTFYSYVEGAWSPNDGIFPQWRAGFSLYANLPASFEAELGFRYLEFSGSPTWIYTGYIGKYYRSWLFGIRTYLTPATYSSAISDSWSATARYYYGSVDDYIGFSAGYGISPDDRYNVVQLNSKEKLTSYKAGVLFKKKLLRTEVFTASADWFNQEYLPGTKGNQYQIGVAWQHRF